MALFIHSCTIQAVQCLSDKSKKRKAEIPTHFKRKYIRQRRYRDSFSEKGEKMKQQNEWWKKNMFYCHFFMFDGMFHILGTHTLSKPMRARDSGEGEFQVIHLKIKLITMHFFYFSSFYKLSALHLLLHSLQ